MSKPDWKDAPEWARYLAKDYDGDWFWYENEPVKGMAGNWKLSEGDLESALPFDEDWENSLETRPEQEKGN